MQHAGALEEVRVIRAGRGSPPGRTSARRSPGRVPRAIRHGRPSPAARPGPGRPPPHRPGRRERLDRRPRSGSRPRRQARRRRGTRDSARPPGGGHAVRASTASRRRPRGRAPGRRRAVRGSVRAGRSRSVRISRRTSRSSRGPSDSAVSPDMAASASSENVWPRTAASWRTDRSAADRPSRRAATRACRVGGTSRAPMSSAVQRAADHHAPGHPPGPGDRSRPASGSSRRRRAAVRRRARGSGRRRPPAGLGPSPRAARASPHRSAGRGAWRSRRVGPCPIRAGVRAAPAGRGSARRSGSSVPSRAGARGSRAGRRPTTGGPRRRTRRCRSAARRSKNVRHAAKSSVRPPLGDSPIPSRTRRRGSIQARSVSSSMCRSSMAAIAARVVSSSAPSASPARRRIISPSAQNVTPSPYEGDRPRCHQTCSTTPSRYFSSSHASRLLPMPAWPTSETRRARRSRPVAWNCSFRKPQLVRTPDERRLERVRSPRAAPVADDADRAARPAPARACP